MRHVRIAADERGNHLDPTPYLDALPGFAAALPPGARAFATDPEHYNFFGKRSVKDLKLRGIGFADGDAELRFGHSCWKHEEDLTIRYLGLQAIQVDLDGSHDVILDEILPAAPGCTHEIACLGGSLTVTCRDLSADWTWADCPERPPR
ncbi:hypothetical protein ABZS66_47885 [Dactylosporangium sp. NPDC005572]|uniref:hypothetical protein n=1 Tax=Dactylosporangium sp. NPDC005572 TaxID=3156889 RepID=UPI0033BBC1CB